MTTESPELKALLASLMHPKLKSIDLSLGRMERHLKAIGNPEKSLAPVVHVAGTNGKGSTIAFLRAMLEAAGYKCHVFTSPHLTHFKERLVVAGEMLDEAELIALLTQIKERSEAFPLTFFEANTVAAFELFARTPADVTLLEVGMGGRFDATNVIESPALSIITPVSMDHEAYLGDSLAKIAFEKAGIIKAGSPVLVAPQAPEAAEVIERVARERGADLHWAKMEPIMQSSLPGEHQSINASVAKSAALYLKNKGFNDIDQTSIYRGLAKASWPGRLQKLTRGELVAQLPEGSECWVDGGHNAAAGEVLAGWVKAQDKPVHVLCAMSEQKDAPAFLQKLAPVATSLGVTSIPDEPLSMPAMQLFNVARSISSEAKLYDTALDFVQKAPENSILLLTGSLYFAGSILEKNS